MEPPGLKRYDFYGGPKPLDDLWTLSRDTLTMRCRLATHRLGWELRLMSGASLLRSQVCRSEGEVFSVGEAWKAEAKLKGWG
jgi:hypothetical protein